MLDFIVVLLLVYTIVTIPFVYTGIQVKIACKRNSLSKLYIERSIINSRIYRD